MQSPAVYGQGNRPARNGPAALKGRALWRDWHRLHFSVMSTHAPPFNPAEVPDDAQVAIVAARFNAHIVDELLSGCLRRLNQIGIDNDCIVVHHVPGAFELPVTAEALAQTEEYAAIICLGCVIR